MKLRNNIFVLTGILLAGFVSCTKTNENYQPAQKEAGSQVYFPANGITAYNLKDYTDGYFEIPVYRVDASSAATITLDVAADAAFTIANTVIFEAGEDVADIKVSWDRTKIVEAKDYKIEIQILDETTNYGGSKYSFTCSIPASWTKLYTGHVYEVCWQEDYDVTMYYQETEFDGIRYCMLENAWNDISGAEPVPTANYYFYWDTKTNNLFVPLQNIGMQSSSGYDIATSEASTFYNAYQSWGIVVPSEQYFSWAPGWTAKNSFFQPYYDGNGGFYLADWMYLCSGGVPTGSGYQFGGDPDYFIADGFIRTTDFNDNDHIGASAPLYTSDAESEFFSSDGGITPYEFETDVRYTEPEDETAETTTYYLTGYFGENHCLAFTAPVPAKLANGSSITDVENDQSTGLYAFGNEIWVSVKSGSIALYEAEDAYPVFNLVIKVYCKDADGNKTYDFGTVSEMITANGVLKDNYTIDDIYGAYFTDYLGEWSFTTTGWETGYPQYTYDVDIADGGVDESGNQLFRITNLSGLSHYFEDVLVASYDSKYGIMSVTGQQITGTYGGENIFVYILDPDASKIYKSAEIWGGICEDGALALVNPYTDINACGFYYSTITSGQGLTAFFNAYGFNGASGTASKIFKKRKEYVTLDDTAESTTVKGVPILKKISGKSDIRSFSLIPVRRSNGRAEIPAPSDEIIR